MVAREVRWSIARTTGLVLIGIVAVPQSKATDCYRYIAGAATAIEIHKACVEELDVPPIFVQALTGGGFEFLVPTTTAEGEPWSAISAAARQWLSDQVNRSAAEAQVAYANLASTTAPIVVQGQISPIEYINYDLANWLNTSGGTGQINTLSQAVDLDRGHCHLIPICDRCETYFCDELGLPWPFKCMCAMNGDTCCVINAGSQ